VDELLSQLQQAIPDGLATAEVEALLARVREAQEQSSPESKGPGSAAAAKEPPTLDELRKLHQRQEKFEEQVERSTLKLEKATVELEKAQKEVLRCREHLEGRKIALAEAKKAFHEADLRRRVEGPIGGTEDTEELGNAEQLVAATLWAATHAKDMAAAEGTHPQPPKEYRTVFKNLRSVWNSFAPLIIDDESSDEEDDEDGNDEDMEAGSGTSTPKAGDNPARAVELAVPELEEGLGSGGPSRSDPDSLERLAKTAKRGEGGCMLPLVTNFNQKYPPAPLPALVLPRGRPRMEEKEGAPAREPTKSRSRSPGPSFRSPAEESVGTREQDSK
jgi:hypothetical protein